MFIIVKYFRDTLLDFNGEVLFVPPDLSACIPGGGGA